ncbi:MAG: 16S rRNA (cytosine(1402)-N(4))-methyltransferase RsmH [Elusimicrobiota bacterium]|jgi:16S rRNA (cytosine1402-N4)-methyltransferase|nr:16S rRNA (cytosine(1402)-N(4))-methyltransferase RsmH [Elusimicrobiota bacterium]
MEQANMQNPSQKQWSHSPILAAEITKLLITKPSAVYLDATLGLGGHTAYFTRQLSAGGIIIGLDKDKNAISMAEAKVNDARLKTFNLSYLQAGEALASLGIMGVQGALFDLGLSSYQLDDGARGFSFLNDGPLDMRFDNAKGITADDIVNAWPVSKIEEILLKYGEERAASKIALAIFQARANGRIESTFQLAKIIESVLPRQGKTHPATKTFQALRIAVNDELNTVEAAPKILPNIILAGGRAAFLTFHSTEDRIIKYGLKELTQSGNWQLVNKKVIEPTFEEIKQNPRARSAKLRVIERLK